MRTPRSSRSRSISSMVVVQLVGMLMLCLSFVGLSLGENNCNTSVVSEEKLGICKGGEGVFLPFPSHPELEWSSGVQIFVYLIGMLWLFAGVALLADAFMCAIEVITSEEVIRIGDTGTTYKSLVWNPTVANLTLMALGSSAPEIVLAIIEITGNDFYAGDLGPSTIVGSASFNLLVIIGICILAVPATDSRKIIEFTVFKITAALSMFAYVWLLLILVVISPDMIEIWEGVLTFIFMPIMVMIAFLADKGYFKQDNVKGSPAKSFSEHLSHEEILEKVKTLAAERNMTVSELMKNDPELVSTELTRLDLGNLKFTRAIYRHEAINTALMGKTPLLGVETKNDVLFDEAHNHAIGEWSVGFEHINYIIGEEEGKIRMKVIQLLPSQHTWSAATAHYFSNNKNTITVQYRTVDGSAKAGVKYVAKSGTLTFDHTISEQHIEVDIIDNDIAEDDEAFTVELFNLQTSDPRAQLSTTTQQAHVVIIDDDKPGKISFLFSAMKVNESCGEAIIPVTRTKGNKGELVCFYSTKNKTAVGSSAAGPGDFKSVDPPEELRFADKEISKDIKIAITDDLHWERDEQFEVILSEADAKNPVIGDQKFCCITIRNDDKVTRTLEWLSKVVNHNHDRFNMGTHEWGKQIWNAATWDSEDKVHAKVIHIFLLPWKVFASLVPPTMWMKGWLAFVVALAFIAIITALIGDVAALFGCAIGLNDSITAITFVALGTSLPDTFASRTAAVNDKSADAALGNVTGSNAVNVFLGLGLPWMIASIYWIVQGPTCEWQAKYAHLNAYQRYSRGGFIVPASGLDVSVGIYVGCSMSCFTLLLWRRNYAGGELGAEYRWPSAIFLFVLWILFILISSLYIENKL